MDNNNDIIDISRIENLRETLGAENAPEVIQGFFDLVEENIKKSFVALEKKDYKNFEIYCHQIKSNVAYLGAQRLYEICTDIENFYVEQNFKSIESIAKKFVTCCEESSEALKKII